MVPLIKLEERRKKIEEGMSGTDSSSEEEDEGQSINIRKLYQEYEKVQDLLSEGEGRFNSRKFDIFKFEKIIGRDLTLPVLSLHLILQHKLTQFVNEPKFAYYMNEVFKTYKQDV